MNTPLCIQQMLNSPTIAADTIAIMAPGREPLTYRGLRAQVDYVQQALHGFGLGRNDRIALALPNGPEMATIFLGVSAVAVGAPLNPEYRGDEFDFYLTDLNARALIVQANSPATDAARRHGIAVIELAPRLEAEAGIFTLSGDPSPRRHDKGVARPEDIVLMLHTSGTTSHPKLVPLLQANLCASAINIRGALALTAADRCLNAMPLFHIHGLIGALLSSIAAGGSIVCAPYFDASRFFAWMQECSPTWYTAVPTMHQAILAGAASNKDIIAQSSLRFIRSSSAALPPQIMAELESVFSTPVIEAYGMTEAAHQMASNPLPPRERKPRSVGLAAGPEIAIMNADGILLGQGQSGEVVIRGANVTPGYANNAAANQSSYSGGWFRTGDQGHLDHDGYLFLTGRLKEIINRGGEKIAPREIDEALLDHPAIAQAVAFAVPHPTLGEDIAAAVVLKKNATTSEQAIRNFLFERLADFKVPSQVVIVGAIPKGPTGKLQRIDLAKKLTENLKKRQTAPKNELERIVAEIFAEVLNIKEFGVNDNFFALGGDSLSAAQVVARIHAIFDIDLSNVIIFRKPTVAELAGEIESTDPEAMGIIAELENLSEEEVRQLLEDEADPMIQHQPR